MKISKKLLKSIILESVNFSGAQIDPRPDGRVSISGISSVPDAPSGIADEQVFQVYIKDNQMRTAGLFVPVQVTNVEEQGSQLRVSIKIEALGQKLEDSDVLNNDVVELIQSNILSGERSFVVGGSRADLKFKRVS